MGIPGGLPPQRPDQLLQPRTRAGAGPAPASVGAFTGVRIIGPGGSISGIDWILNAQGYFQYSGTPGIGNLIQSFAPQPGTDAFGNPYAGSTPITQFITANGQTFESNLTYFIRSGSGSAAGTWAVNGTDFEHSNASTFSLTTNAVNDCVMVAVAQESNSTVTATALASTGTTWTLLGSGHSVHRNRTIAIFSGAVTVTGTNTVTITWSGGAPAIIRINGQEFTPSSGSFSQDGTMALLDATGSTNTWPTMTPAVAGEMYWGYGISTSANTAGSTPGFVYQIDASNNSNAYNLSVSAATAPVWGSSVEQFAGTVLMNAGTGGGGNFTGLIMAPGTWNGQPCQIWFAGAAGTLTMAAQAVSNVAGGTANVVGPSSGANFSWSSADGLWIPL